MSKSPGTYSGAFEYVEIPDDNVPTMTIKATGNKTIYPMSSSISGTFNSSGIWSFIPPDFKEKIWEDMNRLRFGTLDLSSEDQLRLIEAIQKYGDELGKLHFILFHR